MRSAGNFNSEWGYLAPAPSFMRTARVVLVATAIGATAGAAVVLSLIDRPAGERDKTASITAHAIVTSARAAPAMATLAPDSASGALAAPVKVTTAVPPKAAPAIQAALPAAQVPPPAPVASQAASAAAPNVLPPAAATQSTAIAAPQPADGKCRRERSKCGSRSCAEAGSGICLAVGRAARDRSGACRARGSGVDPAADSAAGQKIKTARRLCLERQISAYTGPWHGIAAAVQHAQWNILLPEPLIADPAGCTRKSYAPQTIIRA